ncbi:MAG: hypothetical protein JXA41_00475 [Deltaproteobacteria bacterium]|nr:hypothetical protein [Deltaproteobacteria bacterium]
MKEKSPENFVREFLFKDSHIQQDDGSIKATLLMDEHKEGWMGIPHGGIGMGALMELIGGLNNYPKEEGTLYPLSAEFRMGGSSVKVGDTLDIKVSANDGGAQGVIENGDETFPYISATVVYGQDNPQRKEFFGSCLTENFSDIEPNLFALPYYKNCFVCGVDRVYPGLKRRFYLVNDQAEEKHRVVTLVGFDEADQAAFDFFQQNGSIHPIVPLAVLDETMGWAGFLSSASGAVTVLIGYTFYRPVKAGEKLVFVGRTERVRGRARARVMFWASGGLAAVDEKGRLDMVVAAQGQWMGVAELTDQMHRELIPPGLVGRALEISRAAKTVK